MRGLYGVVTGAERSFGPARNSSAYGSGCGQRDAPGEWRPAKDTVGEFGDGPSSDVVVADSRSGVGSRAKELPINERFQRCRSSVRTALAIGVIRFGLQRALRKMCQVFSRATPCSTGALAWASARLTASWVGESPPGGRRSAVVTQEPPPVQARSARTGTPCRRQIRMMW